MLATQNPFEEAENFRQQHGPWITAGVETRAFWPRRAQVLSFDGVKFLLGPAEREPQRLTLPTISLRTVDLGLTDLECRALIMRLATAIAWREGEKVELVLWAAGGHPIRLGSSRNNTITDYLSSENLCAPASPEARKALAYYREGLSIDNPFYSFLGFYKAFSRSLPNGKERGPWITETLSRISDREAIERRDELIKAGEDISTYVATQGRHAIAHAERDDIVDPDDPSDHQRILQDLPLMRHLAEIAMEERLKIPRPDGYHNDHRYELEGFRNLFNDVELEALRRGEAAPGEKYDAPDHFFVLARKQGQCCPLGKMKIAASGLYEGKLIIDLGTESKSVIVRLTLDFTNERLLFDPLRDVLFRQDRDTRSAVLEELTVQEFLWCLFLNGQVEVWDETGEQRMAMSQPCILTNMILDPAGHQRQIDELNALLEEFPPDSPPSDASASTLEK